MVRLASSSLALSGAAEGEHAQNGMQGAIFNAVMPWRGEAKGVFEALNTNFINYR